MIFSELYSAYYNTVADILNVAIERPLRKNEISEIIKRNAFGESVLTIEPAIYEERWQLISKDGSTPLSHIPTMPLTTIQKRWLKAVSLDPRIRLFTDEMPELEDVEPLFTADDVFVFDRYLDGDPYEDGEYIRNFRLILDAISKKYPLEIETVNQRGSTVKIVTMPDHLEYSEKDDKFRLIGTGAGKNGTVNLGRIKYCAPFTGVFEPDYNNSPRVINRTVEFELTDKRNALERVMMHFAHFEKQAERLEDDRYKVRVSYSKEDETEMLIRILSFGPMIKVTSPQRFVELIKARLKRQKSCER